jgi:excisionase family DNA binding protein
MNRQLNPLTMLADFVVIPADQLRQLVTDAVTIAMRKAAEAAPKPNAGENMPELMTKKEAAAMLRVSTGTVDNYVADGLLSKLKIGTRNVRFKRAEVEKLARKL